MFVQGVSENSMPDSQSLYVCACGSLAYCCRHDFHRLTVKSFVVVFVEGGVAAIYAPVALNS